MTLLAIDMGTGVVLAAFATGGFGLIGGVIAYWSAVRRQDKAAPVAAAVAATVVDVAAALAESTTKTTHLLTEQQATKISMHHDELTREMQDRFERLVREFNGKLVDMTVAVNKMLVILDERLPRDRR